MHDTSFCLKSRSINTSAVEVYLSFVKLFMFVLMYFLFPKKCACVTLLVIHVLLVLTTRARLLYSLSIPTVQPVTLPGSPAHHQEHNHCVSAGALWFCSLSCSPFFVSSRLASSLFLFLNSSCIYYSSNYLSAI